jgi:hypothetical protein
VQYRKQGYKREDHVPDVGKKVLRGLFLKMAGGYKKSF